MSRPYVRLDKNNAAVLLVDHQAGLLSLVRDIDPDKFKNNVLALADLAKYFKLPTVLTTSFETGPNGPLVPELKEMFPKAPYIARPGNINAWDNEDFVKWDAQRNEKPEYGGWVFTGSFERYDPNLNRSLVESDMKGNVVALWRDASCVIDNARKNGAAPDVYSPNPKAPGIPQQHAEVVLIFEPYKEGG
jgi:hypothetical protein